MLEATEEAVDSQKDIMATLPNKKRLTPPSIIVCDTISEVRSRTILKVLFDPGLTMTFISGKCLPRRCKSCLLAKRRSVATLAGSCTAHDMVVLHAIRLPELDKNQFIDQHKALVFDGNIRYDLILGADFLAKSGIDIKYSSGTIEWFDSELPKQDPKCLDNNEYLAMAESLEVHREEELSQLNSNIQHIRNQLPGKYQILVYSNLHVYIRIYMVILWPNIKYWATKCPPRNFKLTGLLLPLNSNIDGASDIEYSNKLANYGNFIAIFDLTDNNGRHEFKFKRLEDRRISNIALKSP